MSSGAMALRQGGGGAALAFNNANTLAFTEIDISSGIFVLALATDGSIGTGNANGLTKWLTARPGSVDNFEYRINITSNTNGNGESADCILKSFTFIGSVTTEHESLRSGQSGWYTMAGLTNGVSSLEVYPDIYDGSTYTGTYTLEIRIKSSPSQVISRTGAWSLTTL